MWPHDEVSTKRMQAQLMDITFIPASCSCNCDPVSTMQRMDAKATVDSRRWGKKSVSRQPSGVEPKPYLELLQEKGIHFSLVQTTDFFFSLPCYSSLASLWLTSCISGLWHRLSRNQLSLLSDQCEQTSSSLVCAQNSLRVGNVSSTCFLLRQA